jgi:hypothetical protein
MPPNLLQKLQAYGEAARRVLATAKSRNISFFAIFLADTSSVFGNRQDHDKHEIFIRLSKVRALAPYLADTIFFSSFYRLPNRNLQTNIPFPIVIKPIWGLQSVGVTGIRDENTLRHFLRKRRGPYIAQHFIRDSLEIGVSYTRSPAGPPDFFGVAGKKPVHSTREWKKGLCKLPKFFHYQDLTRNVDRDRFIELCRTIAEALGTDTFRFDAFVRKEGASLRLDTLRIIDVNTGVFAVDEFLFDPSHSPQFVVEELTRKYTYLLLWGARHSPFPELSRIRKLVVHYMYCCIVTLFGHVLETSLIRKFRDAI